MAEAEGHQAIAAELQKQPAGVADFDLICSASNGDESAFHSLIDRHMKSLFRTALALTGNRADAEDVVQETFMGAFRGLKRFDGRSSVKTWLYAILTRQAAKGWHKSRHIRAAAPIGPDEVEPVAPRKSESAESSGQRMDLMAAIASLPDVYREALVLREVDGLKYEEIARTLKLPRGTVESRIFRARAELRNKLKSYDAARDTSPDRTADRGSVL